MTRRSANLITLIFAVITAILLFVAGVAAVWAVTPILTNYYG